MHNLTVPDNAMADLALARGGRADYLAQQQVPLERLFVGASKLQPGRAMRHGGRRQSFL